MRYTPQNRSIARLRINAIIYPSFCRVHQTNAPITLHTKQVARAVVRAITGKGPHIELSSLTTDDDEVDVHRHDDDYYIVYKDEYPSPGLSYRGK